MRKSLALLALPLLAACSPTSYHYGHGVTPIGNLSTPAQSIIQGKVIGVKHSYRNFTVQDGTGAVPVEIEIRQSNAVKVAKGDIVRVSGYKDFAGEFEAERVEKLPRDSYYPTYRNDYRTYDYNYRTYDNYSYEYPSTQAKKVAK